ncbi:hypothetical protein RRG08_020252 [Elysia crispata]|uniref:Uncharacterized protein n=1 Tax=Elysia crispata TaxID=231223 RepID=A0AAE1B2N6_9GAST|nr:hypothetical protein RRG08_020252 [Elysia crispata]
MREPVHGLPESFGRCLKTDRSRKLSPCRPGAVCIAAPPASGNVRHGSRDQVYKHGTSYLVWISQPGNSMARNIYLPKGMKQYQKRFR